MLRVPRNRAEVVDLWARWKGCVQESDAAVSWLERLATWWWAILGPGLTAVSGLFSEIPWFWWLVGVQLAVAATIWAGVGVVRLREWSRRPPKFYNWRNVAQFKVWVAACLWVEQRPYPTITPDTDAYPRLVEIKDAIAAGAIQVLSGDGGMKSVVSRAALERYAESVGERPKFLFPAG